jgi:hypothetical protein
MHGYTIGLAGDLIYKVKHPEPIFDGEQARLLLSAYLPGAHFIKAGDHDVDMTIAFSPLGTPRLVIGNKRVALHDRWNGDTSMLDFMHLIYSAARQHWLERKLYCVHSACVGNERGYSLIVGHSGVGKTAISLNLVRNHGMKLFSGNKTLVKIADDGVMHAVAGTATVTAKFQDTQRHSADANAVGYQDRSAFVLDKDAYTASEEVPLRMIVIARLNDGVHDCVPVSSLSALHKLFPFFLDVVNAGTLLLDGKEVYGSEPCLETRRRLSATLADALPKTPVYSVAGSMEFVTEQIAAL